jgi:adenosine kinase
MLKYVRIFRQWQVPYIFDPGQQLTSLKAGELKLAISSAKVLIGNDYEIQLILNKLGLTIKKLIDTGFSDMEPSPPIAFSLNIYSPSAS